MKPANSKTTCWAKNHAEAVIYTLTTIGSLKKMSELKPKPLATYYIKVEIGQHVPTDNGFYALFEHKEIVGGMEKLKISIDVGFRALQDYLKRREIDEI